MSIKRIEENSNMKSKRNTPVYLKSFLTSCNTDFTIFKNINLNFVFDWFRVLHIKERKQFAFSLYLF